MLSVINESMMKIVQFMASDKTKQSAVSLDKTQVQCQGWVTCNVTPDYHRNVKLLPTNTCTCRFSKMAAFSFL